MNGPTKRGEKVSGGLGEIESSRIPQEPSKGSSSTGSEIAAALDPPVQVDIHSGSEETRTFFGVKCTLTPISARDQFRAAMGTNWEKNGVIASVPTDVRLEYTCFYCEKSFYTEMEHNQHASPCFIRFRYWWFGFYEDLFLLDGPF